MAVEKLFYLFQNVPNPAKDMTSICFNLLKDADVRFRLLDLTGNLFHDQREKYYLRGQHCINIDASELEDGIYIYQLISSLGVESKKLIVKR